MKTSRRTNAVLLTLLLACAADAQTPSERARPAPANTKNQSPARTTNQSHAPQAASPATKEARDAKTRERRERQSAAAALNEAAASASNAEDSYKRALILALAADALWFHDEQAARALFERAWDAAVASDKEETTAFESAAGAIPVGGASKDISDVPEEFNRLTRARQEVLAAASRHDSRLTERYIAELRESVKSLRGEDAAREDDRRRYDVRESLSEFDDEQTRLNLSRSLIEEGDYGQASEVAAPELAGGVSAALIRFLIQFHERAPTEADSLYGRLLARVAADPRADANDVLLLSSYVFTPSMLAAVDAGGSVNFGIVNGESGGRPVNDAPVAANVTRDFFNVAARVLLRPRPAARQHGETVALFFAITRLLPFFERGAPQLAPQLQARRQSLAAELDASSLDSLSSAAGRESLTPANPTDPLAADLEYSKRGPTSESRDAARQRIVMRAVKLKLWERARAAASEMEDAEARAGSSALIAVSQVASVADAFGDDEDGDERAARFVQNADVPPLARALGYARAALLASKRHRAARAGELLDMAQSFAEQTDSGTEARLVALLVVATTAEEFDPSRAWTAAPAIVQAANEVRDAEPDELSGGFRLPQLDGAEGVGLGEELADFRLDTFFASLAARDFPRALKGARSLSDATTRSLVIIAASRARLAASVAHAPEPERAR